MAKRKVIQYAVKQIPEDSDEKPYFCFYDSILEALQSEEDIESNENVPVEIWKFEGEVLGTYQLEKVAKKVKG